MNEKVIEKKLREGVKKRGGWAMKFVTPGTSGVLDRIVLMPGGKIWFVELKTTGKTLSPLQKVFAAKVEVLGFKTMMIDDQDSLDEFFKKLDCEI